jgi:site-specific DNA-methyltransferase (adenine-specific)
MSDGVMRVESNLPSKIEDLAQFVLVGRDKLAMVRAGIKALDKLDVAEGVRQQKKEEAQMLAEALLDAEVKIGEILARMPKASGKHENRANQYTNGKSNTTVTSSTSTQQPIETKQQAIAKLGFDKMQASRFETLAANKEIVEQIKQEARENDDLATRTAVLQVVKERDKKFKFEEAKTTFNAEIKPKNIDQIIIHADSREYLQSYDGPKFDLLLSDPPYGMDFKSGWSDKEKIANDKIDDTIELFESVLSKSVKHLKNDAHFYLFGSIDYIGELRPIIEKYLTLKNILIWDRRVIGMGDLKSYGKSFDVVYFGINKVWRDLNGTRDRDILYYNRCDPAKMIHPTEKPLDMLEYLIKKSTKENDLILDPFAGGGSTLVAAKNTNRKCTGIEIESKYVDLIKSRL